MRTTFLVMAVVLGGGCNCHPPVTGGGGGGTAGSGNGGGTSGVGGGSGQGDLLVTPPEATVDVTVGGAPGTAQFNALFNGTDVTSMASWSVDDTTLGSISGGLFTSSATHGGSSLVRASWSGHSGTATVHVKLHGTTGTCMGCPTFPPSRRRRRAAER